MGARKPLLYRNFVIAINLFASQTYQVPISRNAK